METSKPGRGNKVALAATILAVLTLALIVYSSTRLARVSCEVCVSFNGRNQCRTATAATQQEAIRTATDNACDFLSAGMAEGIRCSNTPPVSVTCAP